MDSPHIRYRIDGKDRLTEVNEGWLAFAQANEGPALDASHVIGRPLWDFFADATTRDVYRGLLQRLRLGSARIRFRFRCDAPDRRRLLAMEMTGLSDGEVQFSVRSVLEESRDPQQPGGEHLAVCGWCKRFRIPPDTWVEVEQAIDALGLFAGPVPAAMSHGMCPGCYEAMMGVIDDPALGAAGTVTLGALAVTAA